ncbi:unnamed protein product [Rhizoctonia solani]|uniref:Uncharacterized protein n=1 Tax=Rhizoctonia solani TaxID=456999 RepID=A0A8H2Y041_9AGAM|nr:unnamed protein product [Rhizoctonia solani]
MIVKACAAQGRECQHFIVNVAGKGETISPPENWPNFYLVSIYVSSYTQFLHSKEGFNPPGPEIAEMLEYSSKLVGHATEKATWSLTVMICAENEFLSPASLEILKLKINGGSVFDAASWRTTLSGEKEAGPSWWTK